MMESRTVRALAWSSALAFSLTGAAQAQRSYDTRQVSLPQGTVLRAELNDSLSSTQSRPGDRFTATIDPTGTGLPSGTEVVGRVTAVRRASEKQPGVLDVTFSSLRLPDGRTYPIDASLTSLDAKNVRRTSGGRLESRGTASRDKAKFIGYGAGVGAIIGALSGGDLLKSGLIGAAAGYLYGQLGKDKQVGGRYSDVNLRTGTEFGVLLERRMVLAVSDDRSTRYDDRYPRADDRTTRYDDRYDSRYDSRYSRDEDRPARYDDRTAGSIDRYRSSDVRVMVNGRDVRFGDNQPFVSAGRVMLPFEATVNATGHHFDYDARQGNITVWGDRGEARMSVGSSYAWINGERVRLDTPAQRVNGVLYVPTQFLTEATGVTADWDAADRTLRLTTRNRSSFPAYDADYRSR